MKSIAAFTLIELLIVIAIIAVLALIAVPNFLEAQVRAKVARAQSDMRTIATAVEAYAVDHHTLPLDADDHCDFNPMDPFHLARWNQKAFYPRLTTPIAYITSAPSDPFHEVKHEPEFFTDLLFPGDPPFPYAYITYGGCLAYSGQPSNKGRPVSYGLTSLGPNRIYDSASRRGIDDTYDPTNGTVSRGDIIRTGGPQAK